MTPKNKLEKQLQVNRFSQRLILVLALALFANAFATYRIPRTMKVYTAPDISSAFVQKKDEVPLTTVYGFAASMWEHLNFCQENCGQEYNQSIENMRNYLTNTCYEKLSKHFYQTKSLYSFRSRRLLPTDNSFYDPSRIRKVSSNTWFVKLELMLNDDVNGVETRNQIMLYPLRIVKTNVPEAYNKWGLAVDCYFGDGPKVLQTSQTNKQTQ